MLLLPFLCLLTAATDAYGKAEIENRPLDLTKYTVIQMNAAAATQIAVVL